MKCIHILCKNAQTVRAIRHPVYESGHWDLPPEEAESLVGGKVFLHQAKDKPSYFGGVVESYRLVAVDDKAHEQRVAFALRASMDCKGVKWRGAKHAMAWTGGIIDCEE